MRRTASSSWRLVRPPGSGVPVPGADPGSTTSTSTERKTPSHPSVAMAKASSRHGVEPPGDDLGHLEAAHALLGHPGERLGLGPVAAQADLEEAVAAHRARLDEPAHRGAVAVRGSRTGCRRCRRGRRSGSPRPGPSPRGGRPRWRRAGRWCGRRPSTTGTAPAAATVATASSSARERAAPCRPGASPRRPRRPRPSSTSGSTPSARCGRRPSWGR